MRTTARLICTLLLLLSLLCLFHQATAHGGIDDGDGEVDAPVAPAAEAGSLRSKGLVAVKVWCLVILLVVTFAAGVSPYFYRWNEAFLLLGTQFAAGIFLGTALMHFLADSNSTFRGLTKNPYPFAYMLTCAGFMITMLADCGILAVTRRSRRRDETARVVGDGGEDGGGGHRKEEEEEDDSSGGNHHHPAMLVVRTSSLEDAVLLIVALCFHSVFEGIAIGVSGTESDAWRNLWTIGLHKVFAAVAMGIALLRLIPKRPFLMTVAYAAAFAASSPLGVGIGIGIDATAEGSAADWTYAISMGFATGVFVYIAVNHLMAKGYRPLEPSRVDRPFFKFLAVLLGVAVMAVVMIWD